MFGRIAKALELIASELGLLRKEMQAIRQEQRDFMELSKREAQNGPARILEMFEQVKTLTGGEGDGR
jgi:uncharacterized coiled-coil DUF342 family protein